MTVTLNLPPEVEQAFLAEAKAKGISPDAWVGEVLIARASQVRDTAPSRQSRLWELRRDLALGDVSVKELIAEGRE